MPRKRQSIPKDRSRTGAEMSLPRSVAEVLTEHVTLEVEGIDRMYLNVYVPVLQRQQGVASFFRFHRGHQFASSAWMDPISKTSWRRWRSMRGGGRYRSFSFAKVSGKMTLRQSNARPSTSLRGLCLSGKHRRKRRCCAPSGAGMKRLG